MKPAPGAPRSGPRGQGYDWGDDPTRSVLSIGRFQCATVFRGWIWPREPGVPRSDVGSFALGMPMRNTLLGHGGSEGDVEVPGQWNLQLPSHLHRSFRPVLHVGGGAQEPEGTVSRVGASEEQDG